MAPKKNILVSPPQIKYYPCAIHKGEEDLDSLSEKVASRSTISKADCYGVIIGLTEVLSEVLTAGIQWYNGTYRYTSTTGDGLYAGSMNTSMIVATQMADNQTGNFAAKVCADYSVTVDGVTYGDWYLPSKYELNLLYVQKTAVGGFESAYYWSSCKSSAKVD